MAVGHNSVTTLRLSNRYQPYQRAENNVCRGSRVYKMRILASVNRF